MGGTTVTVIVSVATVHGGFVTVHTSVYVVMSTAVEVNVDVALLGFVTVPPVPLMIVHVPVWPLRAAVAPKVVVVVPQAGVLSVPAFAAGDFLNVTITVSVEEVHGLFAIVQTKVYIACPLPAENVAIEKVAVGSEPPPPNDAPLPPLELAMLQLPVPVAGLLAANAVEVPQIV